MAFWFLASIFLLLAFRMVLARDVTTRANAGIGIILLGALCVYLNFCFSTVGYSHLEDSWESSSASELSPLIEEDENDPPDQPQSEFNCAN